MRALYLVLLLLTAFGSSVSYGATVFYLHGKIVEDQGDLASHPAHGIYKYKDIVQNLRTAGHSVVSEVRPKGTSRGRYAQKVVDQINTLIEGGKGPEDIAVIGFSKGAQIAVLVSQTLRQEKVRFVIQAVCGNWIRNRPNLKLVGDVYSMYEKSDSALSCSALFHRSNIQACETALNTGLSHGLFFQPRDAWVKPMLRWIDTRTCESRLPAQK